MNNNQIINLVRELAGTQRSATFCASASFIIAQRPKFIVETGCFRGITGDGNSTLIFAVLAREIGAKFWSLDINPDHVKMAKEYLLENGLDAHADVVLTDSVKWLSENRHPIGFCYLDSFDHDPANPLPCQQHQLSEVNSAQACLSHPSAFLLDDNVEDTGGKTKLSSQRLTQLGYTLSASGYQLLFTKQ